MVAGADGVGQAVWRAAGAGGVASGAIDVLRQ